MPSLLPPRVSYCTLEGDLLYLGYLHRVLAGGVHDHCGALGLDGSAWEAGAARRRQQAQEGRDAAIYALDVSAYAPEDAPPLSVEQQERFESAQRRVQEAAAALPRVQGSEAGDDVARGASRVVRRVRAAS